MTWRFFSVVFRVYKCIVAGIAFLIGLGFIIYGGSLLWTIGGNVRRASCLRMANRLTDPANADLEAQRRLARSSYLGARSNKLSPT